MDIVIVKLGDLIQTAIQVGVGALMVVVLVILIVKLLKWKKTS